MASNPGDIGPLLQSNNASMARAIATAQQVAGSDVAVLLTGESGTGKHLLAHTIHGWSARCDRPFVTARSVHGGCRSNGELFGYFDQVGRDQYRWLKACNAGTLFFEEVGTLPAAQQAALVRLLDERQLEQATGDLIDADIRVIAATSCDLDAEMRAGCFREDLHFRLSTVTIALPPLRDRQQDLLQLTDYFLAHLAARYDRSTVRLSPEVREVFARYSWPGNVRELESILERGIVLSRGDTISIDELPERLLGPATKAKNAGMPTPSLRDMERSQIELAIRESATLGKAARRLGIDPATLWRKRKRYHLA
jgi:NtrC-family two-component system response regulator AlgB